MRDHVVQHAPLKVPLDARMNDHNAPSVDVAMVPERTESVRLLPWRKAAVAG